MRIQYCSDLHLEINKKIEYPTLLEPVAPVLALVGDIGDPESVELESFLTWCCGAWKQVIYIPGNHEFWRVKPGTRKTVNSAMAILKGFEAKLPNLMVCWRTKFVSEDGVVVLATPLWSRPAEGVIPHENEHAWIDPDRSFDSETLSRLHEADLLWLQRELQINRKRTVVVLTHYAPSLMLVDRRLVKEADESLYASDLDTLIRPPIVAWVCGHVHQTIQWTKDWENANGESGNVLILTNPRGYHDENIYYRKECVLRIDPKAHAHSKQDEDECLFETTYKTL